MGAQAKVQEAEEEYDDGSIRYVASPTARRFHACNDFTRAIKGPVGSGKSVMCVIEILARAMAQEPFRGVRKSRCLVIRQTYAELKSTTIRTFLDWLGPMGRIVYDAPIRFEVKRTLADNTILDLEVMFLPLDRPDDVKKLKSLECTFAWVNEASEVPMDVLKVLRGRVGRYPSKREGGASWKGIWLDTNPPPVRSDFYRLFEITRPKNHRIFHQPGGLMRDPDNNDEYIPNPDAENIENLPGGYEYYFNQVNGATEDYINVFVLGEYGSTFDGKPVYSQYDDASHAVSDGIEPARNGVLIVGMDFGLNPAAAFTQLSPTGTLLVLDEIAPTDVTFEEFVNEHLLPKLHNEYRGYRVLVIGDPSATGRHAMSKMTAFEHLRTVGIAARPAPTNDFIPRRDAVAYFLTRANGFLLDSKCEAMREGFLGGYRYKKMVGSNDNYRPEPDKGYHSHIHDALQYAAMYYHRLAVGDAGKRIRVKRDEPRRQVLFA